MKYSICLFYLPILPCFYAYFRAYSTLLLCHFWPSLHMMYSAAGVNLYRFTLRSPETMDALMINQISMAWLILLHCSFSFVYLYFYFVANCKCIYRTSSLLLPFVQFYSFCHVLGQFLASGFGQKRGDEECSNK